MSGHEIAGPNGLACLQVEQHPIVAPRMDGGGERSSWLSSTATTIAY